MMRSTWWISLEMERKNVKEGRQRTVQFWSRIKFPNLPRNRKESPFISDVVYCRLAFTLGKVDKIISSREITVADLLVPLRCMRMAIRDEIIVLVLWWKLWMIIYGNFSLSCKNARRTIRNMKLWIWNNTLKTSILSIATVNDLQNKPRRDL